MLYNYSIWFVHPTRNRMLIVYKNSEDLTTSVQLMQSLNWIVKEITPIHTYSQPHFDLRRFRISANFDK
jgi:hypothetical protein